MKLKGANERWLTLFKESEKNNKQTISEVRKNKDFPRKSPLLYKELQRTKKHPRIGNNYKQ